MTLLLLLINLCVGFYFGTQACHAVYLARAERAQKNNPSLDAVELLKAIFDHKP